MNETTKQIYQDAFNTALKYSESKEQLLEVFNTTVDTILKEPEMLNSCTANTELLKKQEEATGVLQDNTYNYIKGIENYKQDPLGSMYRWATQTKLVKRDNEDILESAGFTKEDQNKAMKIGLLTMQMNSIRDKQRLEEEEIDKMSIAREEILRDFLKQD